MVRGAWRRVHRVAAAYARHFGGLVAAAVSFQMLLSLVPLLTLGVAVTGWLLGGSERAVEAVRKATEASLPGSGDLVYGALRTVHRDSGWLGLIGAAGLVFTASTIFAMLESAFNLIFHVERPRRWLVQRLLALGTAALALVLLLLSIGLTSATAYVLRVRIPLLRRAAGDFEPLLLASGVLVPLIVSITLFTLLYRIVPNTTITTRAAVAGGVFAGTGWEVAKHLFTIYVAHFANYDRVYGSLGGIVVLMVWVYFSSSILVMGAEVAADVASEARGSLSHRPSAPADDAERGGQ